MRKLVAPVHYDFASSLCYVAHRVIERLAVDLETLGVALDWTPLDTAQLLGWRRGEPIPEERRANAARVARELAVPLAIPERWRDARPWNAAALLARDAGRDAAFRDAAWCALYEEPGEPALEAVAARVGLALDRDALAAAIPRVAQLTEQARDAEVSGVPTFVLAGLPLAGIQDEATMRAMLARFASRHRTRS